MLSGTAAPLCSLQEEVLGKRSKLQRLTAAVTLAQQECASLAAQYQSERERLLDEIRRLGTQMKQKAGWVGRGAAAPQSRRPGHCSLAAASLLMLFCLSLLVHLAAAAAQRIKRSFRTRVGPNTPCRTSSSAQLPLFGSQTTR